MADSEDNNENSSKLIEPTSQCSKELRVSLETLDLENLSKSPLSLSFSASEVMGRSGSFNRRASIGGGSLQKFSPGNSVSTPSVRTLSVRRNISMSSESSQRRTRRSKQQSPVRPKKLLSQLTPPSKVITVSVGSSDEDFREERYISNKPKKHKKNSKGMKRRREGDSLGNQSIRMTRKQEREKSKLNGNATIKIESDGSSDETSRHQKISNQTKKKVPDRKNKKIEEIDLTSTTESSDVVEVVLRESPRKALNEYFVFDKDKSNSKVDSDILDVDLNQNVNFLKTQSQKEMLESHKIKKENIDNFLIVNGVKCGIAEELPLENRSDVDSEKDDDVETAIIEVGREQEELISTSNSTPANHRRIPEGQQSTPSLKKKRCRKLLFENKELEEPIKGDLKFKIKRNSDGLTIEKGGRNKVDLETEEKKGVQKENTKEKNKNEFEPKSEAKKQKKKEEKVESSDSSDDERENSPSRSMPTLEHYDPSKPISPTPRSLPKIIEVQKLVESDLMDLNNLASPIPTPSRCQNNPDFDTDEICSMVENEAALNNEAELAGEILLPLKPEIIINLDAEGIIGMISETEKDDVVEPPNESNVSPFSSNAVNRTDDGDDQPPVLKKRKITSSKGSLGFPDKKMKLDRVVDGPLFGDPKYLTSNNRIGVKASKTLDLNGDFCDSSIHEVATQVVDKNKSKHANDETVKKPKNGLTNGDNDTDLDYSSYSSSSDEEIEEKVEKEKKGKDKRSEDEDIEDDDDELEEDERCEDAKNSAEEDEEEKEMENEDAKNDKSNEEDLDDCLSLFYSDDEQLLKSPERKISSKYQFPRTKPKTAPKPETITQPAPAKNTVSKIAIKYSKPDSKNKNKPKESKPESPKNEVPKRKPSPIIFNSSSTTISKVIVKNSSNVRTAPKAPRNQPQNNAIPKPIPRIRGQLPAQPEASAGPSNSHQIHPREVAVVPAPHPREVTREDWMMQDFDKDMAKTNCNGNEALFDEPVRENGPALNGVFPSTHPANEYRQPGFVRHQSVQQTINTCNKDEMPSSVSASNILKPQSDVRMRVGHTGLDKQKVFEKMCFNFLRCGKCPKLSNRTCPFDHRIQKHCELTIDCSRDYLFSFVKLGIDNHFEHYLKTNYNSFLERLDYLDACHMFKLLNTRNIVHTRLQVDTVMKTMLGKQNAILSRVVLDLTKFSENPQLQNMLFDSAMSLLERPGLFWDTFKDLYQETGIAPKKEHVDVIVEECVKLQKNHDHVKDVCQYFYHLKYDENVPFDISGNYFDRFIKLLKKHNLNTFLEVFDVQDEDFLSPTSPNIVQMCAPPFVENERDRVGTYRPNEAQGISDEQMQIDEPDSGWKLIKIDVPKETRSAFHDRFGELHQDIHFLHWSLKEHDYVKAIEILKKYAMDLGKSNYYNTCYNKCWSTVLQIGKMFEEDGQFENEKQFWEFVKDLLDVRDAIRRQDYLGALHLFRKYVRHSNEAMRHRFSYVSYLLIREEFTVVEKYFTLIDLAVRGGARSTLFAMLLDLGTRILLEIVDKGHWYHAYKLVKHLESVTCGASLTLLQAQIFLANHRPEKAFSLLKSTKLFYKDRRLWLVPPQDEDKSLRVHVINALMKSLICNDVKKAFALFEIMIKDQTSVWRPIDLTYHANYLLLELALGYNTETLVELCWLVMKYNILLEDSVFRLGVIMLTRHNIELGKVFFEFAANRGVYNILKNQKVNARVIRLILRSNSTEEEIFLIASDMLEQLSLHCGQGVTGITRGCLKVFFIFQRYPAANQLYQNTLFKNSTKRDEEYRNARKVLEKVLQTRFNPSIRLVNHYTGRFVQLQVTTVIEYLKNFVK